MPNEIVQVNQPGFLAPAVTVENALAAFQAKKDLIDKIMRPGVDFGTVPGLNYGLSQHHPLLQQEQHPYH